MQTKVNLPNVTIVLHQPRYSENIGAAARAIRNMGVGQLAVVAPPSYEVEKALKLATHAAAGVVQQLQRYTTLAEALEHFQYVVGTTARTGGQRQTVHDPANMAQRLIDISHNNRVAIVFGPEDSGLTNEDIRLCHALVTIPTAEFSSVNLAQAVMIMCYELMRAGRTRKGAFAPRLASRHELNGMYAQLKEILVRIDYIKADNADYWMNRIRSFFNRLPLRSREVSVIRGICRQINWYGQKKYRDGQKTGSKETLCD